MILAMGGAASRGLDGTRLLDIKITVCCNGWHIASPSEARRWARMRSSVSGLCHGSQTDRDEERTMSWANGPWLGFDTETTGVNPREDRIVTAALVLRDRSGMRQRTWLVDPGVPIPQSAADVHGITTDVARAMGEPPAQALEELATEIAHFLRQGVPLVVYNACFDLTLMEYELHRHGLPLLSQRLGRDIAPVIDPLVLDRAVDPYRRGDRER